MTALARYHGAPGDPGRTPAIWPADEPRLAADGLELVIAVHPRCPCTVTSIDALAGVVADLRDRGQELAVHVLLRMPEAGPDDAWRDGPAARRLDALGPRAERLDPGGRIAARWGMATSGHVAVFGPGGRRLLDGGLTPARAHAADPATLDAIAARLAAGRPVASRPVFGCPVPDPDDAAAASPAPGDGAIRWPGGPRAASPVHPSRPSADPREDPR